MGRAPNSLNRASIRGGGSESFNALSLRTLLHLSEDGEKNYAQPLLSLPESGQHFLGKGLFLRLLVRFAYWMYDGSTASRMGQSTFVLPESSRCRELVLLPPPASGRYEK